MTSTEKGDFKSVSEVILTSNLRLQRSIVYGSIATPIKKPETDHTHRWTAYVRGAHDEDISSYIRKVVFKLHESFPDPVRTIEKAPFEVNETGWGEFQMGIKIVFQDPDTKPINLTHHLKLYPTIIPSPSGGGEGDDSAPPNTSLKTSRPVINEHYEEIIFDPPSSTMREILLKEPQFMDLTSSPRYSELAKVEAEELHQIDTAISLIKAQLDRHLAPVTEKPPAINKTNDIDKTVRSRHKK